MTKSRQAANPEKRDMFFLLLAWVSFFPGIFLDILTVRPGVGDEVVDRILKEIGLISDSSYSIVESVLDLIDKKEFLLSLVIALFSLVFPFYKLWISTKNILRGTAVPRLIEKLSLLSLLDIVVIAILVVSMKGVGGTDISPGIAVYFYCFSSVILFSVMFMRGKRSMVSGGNVALLTRLRRRPSRASARRSLQDR